MSQQQRVHHTYLVVFFFITHNSVEDLFWKARAEDIHIPPFISYVIRIAHSWGQSVTLSIVSPTIPLSRAVSVLFGSTFCF